MPIDNDFGACFSLVYPIKKILDILCVWLVKWLKE